MACSSCGQTVNTNSVKLSSEYVPQSGKETKMTDVILSFSIEKKKNDVPTEDTKSG